MDSSWLFNLGANVYGWFTAQAAWRASCASVADQLADLDGTWIADLGCGPGVSTFELARRVADARLIGIDLAPRMLDEARRREPSSGACARVTWLRANAELLPIATASLDACTGHSFLYLVQDRSGVLREVRRVLRPGGRLVLLEPNDEPMTLRRALRISNDPRHLVSVSLWRPFSRLHGRFTLDSLTRTLSAAGFVNCQASEAFGGLGLLARAEAPG